MTRKLTKHLIHTMILSCCMMNAFAASQGNVNWGYTGKLANWGQLSPEFAVCANGKSQSPINIDTQVQKATYALSIQYQDAPMEIVNDGETSLTINRVRTIINKGHAIQLDFSKNGPKETIIFDNKPYHLIEFHVHTPSETAIKGQKQAMEIHFVHESEDGQAAVLAVLVKEGAANTELQDIIDHFPNDRGIKHKVANEKINPAILMPKKRDYYHFAGSLTTPPCTEGLHWLVMPDTITASAEQIKLFKLAVDGDNARPLQARHQRNIYYSVEA